MYTNIEQKNYSSFTNLFLLAVSLLLFSTHCTENLDQFYSTSFLKDYKAVHKVLKKHGFRDITFKTTDNLTLSGLFLSRPHATCNVIICAGFFPGKKEGLATFYAFLPNYCNILLFDARGRGSSEGPLLYNLWRYGINEHKDISGAISWINKNNTLPIIIGGTCSGVFNAAHALIDLAKNGTLAKSRVKGLFFDSGWGSVLTMSQSVVIANIKKYLSKTIACMYGTKKNIDQRILYKLLFPLICHCFKAIHSISAKPLITPYEHTTNLFDKINQIPIPIFFIHSYEDVHADITNAMKLSQLAPNSRCWWIEKSFHAKHYLIHRNAYKEKLTAFIESVIQ